MPTGRPLRFLLVVTGGWTAMRLVMLWPGELPAIAEATLASPAAAEPVTQERPQTIAMQPARKRQFAAVRRWKSQPTFLLETGVPDAPSAPLSAPPPPDTHRQIAVVTHPVAPLAAGVPLAEPMHRTSRWSGSFWLVAREGSGAGSGFTGPQLGGSQAGLRIAYALAAHLAVAARVASPLGAGQRDAAIGLEWRPTRLPIRLVAEQRFTLGAGRGGPTIGVIGGFGPVPVLYSLRAEGYGQAGYIVRGSGGEGFADGAMRLSHPLGELARIKFDLGASTWGAAQTGAFRLDVGPSLDAVARIGHQPVRLSLEWRKRIAGNATPASGPALSLGMDF